MDHKYEEALERARKFYNDCVKGDNPIQAQRYVDIFPELKESEDERIRTRLIALVEAFGQGEYKDEMLAYLERQKEQKPAEWSEEDERIRAKLLSYFNEFDESTSFGSREVIEIRHWLKSLRPLPHWKPSEYTLSLVKKVANGEMLTHIEQMAMETLCNDLQKLL